jgi:GAF domain-containing protein
MSQKDSPELLREELYETMNDQDLTIPDKQHRALEIGLEYLGLENGYIQQLNDDLPYDEVVASVGEDPEVLPEGTELDRATTYCRRTVKSQSPIALSNASEQGWADDPAYEKHGFDCYLGTAIFVAGEVYGTICFISKDAQDAEFSSGEKTFVELLARLLGRAMEAAEYVDVIETQKTEER